jgi:hypothetical protein
VCDDERIHQRGEISVKIETTSLMGGAPQRRVLFSDEVARGLHGTGDVTRAGIFQDAREWAAWAASLVSRNRADEADAPRPDDQQVEVR